MIRLVELYDICKNKDTLLAKLREYGLIPQDGEYLCPNCQNPKRIYSNAADVDGWRWHCHAMISKRKQKAEKCGTTVRFRNETFFAQSHLTMFQVALLFCSFARFRF